MLGGGGGGGGRLDTRRTEHLNKEERNACLCERLLSRPNEEDNLRNWVGAKKNEREREREGGRERERERDGKLSLSSSFTLLEEARGRHSSTQFTEAPVKRATSFNVLISALNLRLLLRWHLGWVRWLLGSWGHCSGNLVMAFPQGYLSLYSCPPYGSSAITGPRTDDLGRSSSGSAFAPYASTAFSSLQYSPESTAPFPSYGVSFIHNTAHGLFIRAVFIMIMIWWYASAYSFNFVLCIAFSTLLLDYNI